MDIGVFGYTFLRKGHCVGFWLADGLFGPSVPNPLHTNSRLLGSKLRLYLERSTLHRQGNEVGFRALGFL